MTHLDWDADDVMEYEEGVSYCQDCGVEIEEYDIPLCDECHPVYDLDKFWIKHDFEIGDWHEPYEFNENADIKAMYLKDPEIVEGITEEEIMEFRRKLSIEFLGTNVYEISDATISQILAEVK